MALAQTLHFLLLSVTDLVKLLVGQVMSGDDAYDLDYTTIHAL